MTTINYIKRYAMLAVGLVLLCAAAGGMAGEKAKPEHRGQDLQKYAGTWDIRAVIRVSESAEPMEITGIAEKELIGDRWIVSRFEADFFGTPFSGQDFYGFDENSGKWTAIWVDSLNKHSVHYTEVAQPDGEFIMVGRNKHAVSGEWAIEKRTDVWRSDDEFDTNFVIQLPDGTEFQSLSVQHKRSALPSL